MYLQRPDSHGRAKYQNLRAALKGKAAKALVEWQIRDCFIEPAWRRVKELYDEAYVTSKELFYKMFSLRIMESAQGDRLQIMSNATQDTSRQLKALGCPAEHYDLMFIQSVHGKLDEKTSVAWDLRRQSDRPTSAEFTTFLDRQAKALKNAYCTDIAPKTRNANDRRRSSNGGFQTTGDRGNHHNG